MKKLMIVAAAALVGLPALSGCQPPQEKPQVVYEQYTLDNGLKVVLHPDTSDPLVSVAIQFHVGSAREKAGKTGFAHFFEHMLFQRSENLPRNAFFQKISAMGGEFNGGTGQDGTVYFETVPRDALEKVLWMESDRMGYFINTVTQAGLEREIDVILNEKRQTTDSRPYGQLRAIMAQELYPAGHPYSWTVIGKMDDIRSATIADVKEFYATYYIPNNATLCIAGDFDMAQTKEMIQKYFGEIAAGKPIEKPQARNAVLAASKKVVYEDPFAPLPYFSLTFPSVEQYHPDAAALDVLGELLAGSKNSPLYRLVVEAGLAPEIYAYNLSQEVAGEFVLATQTYPGISLDSLQAAIDAAFARFEAQGVDPKELEMIKAMEERNTYNRLSNVNDKAIAFARNTEFGGKPDRFLDELAALQAVTAEDVLRVYKQYVQGKNFLAISMVPKGQLALALSGSVPAVVEVENVEDASSQETASAAGALVDDDYARTPSAFDRSIEPPYGANSPQTTLPEIWETQLPNGLQLTGITQTEVPMASFRLILPGGQLLDAQGKTGTAYLCAALLNEGTTLRTAEEVEQALKLLGASVNVTANVRSTVINGNCLSRNFAQVMEIVEEMILQPRFDPAAFEREKNKVKAQIEADAKSTSFLAANAAFALRYGKDAFLATETYGTLETLEAITLQDVQEYHQAWFTPRGALLNVAGHLTQDQCQQALNRLAQRWQGAANVIPVLPAEVQDNGGKLFFVDFPGAKQSVIYVIGDGPALDNADRYGLNVLNFKLGSGSNGELFNVLRLQRGYTYGAYSNFSSNKDFGYFRASSSVQSAVTRESVELFRQILGGFGPAFNQELLQVTQDALLRKQAFAFESQSALLGLLGDITFNGLPRNYVQLEEEAFRKATVEEVQKLAAEYLDPSRLIYVVVGDAKTQLKNLPGAILYK